MGFYSDPECVWLSPVGAPVPSINAVPGANRGEDAAPTIMRFIVVIGITQDAVCCYRCRGRINSTLQKQGQHARITIHAVMGYFPVGKKSDQWKITELFLNYF